MDGCCETVERMVDRSVCSEHTQDKDVGHGATENLIDSWVSFEYEMDKDCCYETIERVVDGSVCFEHRQN